MPKLMFKFMITVAFYLTISAFTQYQTTAQTIDPLSAWAEGKNKARIISFVKGVTTPSAPEYKSKEQRIAIFDMDGTLINERPYPFVLRATLPLRPCPAENEETKAKLPTNADIEAGNYTIRDLFRLFLTCASTHGKKSYTDTVNSFLNEMLKEEGVKLAYLPMQQFIAYLKTNDFTVYISTGSPIEASRVIGKTLFDLPPEQVIGTETVYKFDPTNADDPIRMTQKLAFLNLDDGKVFSVQQRAGKLPIIAAGNGDTDLALLKYAALQPQSLIMVIDHDDAAREKAYGTDEDLAKTAIDNKWLLISMKNNFRQIFKK